MNDTLHVDSQNAPPPRPCGTAKWASDLDEELGEHLVGGAALVAAVEVVLEAAR